MSSVVVITCNSIYHTFHLDISCCNTNTWHLSSTSFSFHMLSISCCHNIWFINNMWHLNYLVCTFSVFPFVITTCGISAPPSSVWLYSSVCHNMWYLNSSVSAHHVSPFETTTYSLSIPLPSVANCFSPGLKLMNNMWHHNISVSTHHVSPFEIRCGILDPPSSVSTCCPLPVARSQQPAASGWSLHGCQQRVAPQLLHPQFPAQWAAAVWCRTSWAPAGLAAIRSGTDILQRTCVYHAGTQQTGKG